MKTISTKRLFCVLTPLLLFSAEFSASAQDAVTTLNCRRPNEAYSTPMLSAEITVEYAIASTGKVVLESKNAKFFDRQGKFLAEIPLIESVQPRFLNHELVSFENFPREIESIVLDQSTQFGQIVRQGQAYAIDCHRPGPN